MEIVAQESIQIPYSVVVSGLTDADADEEVATYLQKYGTVNRFLHIDNPKSDYHKHMIVEFKQATAMLALEPQLPLKLENPTQTGTQLEIKSLASVYTQDARTRATRAYMEQLSELARLSGQSVEQMMKEELATFTAPTLAVTSPSSDQESSSDHNLLSTTESFDQGTVLSLPDPQSENPSDATTLKSSHDAVQPQTPLSPNKNLTDLNSSQTPPLNPKSVIHPMIDINPPHIQRVVVEHVVRNSENSPHFSTPARLRGFSGRSPRPNNEADYDTWRTSVEVLIKDPSISDLHCTHRILDSLLPPAAEVTKHLGPHANPSVYLELLDSAYGTVEDGDELYARFMGTFQNDGEKPSAYLQRLHVALSTTMRRGGVSTQDFDQQLLKQFCRGCWENALLIDLQLEQKKESPPSFAELLLLLRTEEDKQAAKMSRMKQHLGTAKPAYGATKQRVMSHLHTVQTLPEQSQSTEIETLKKQLADLSAQLSSITAAESQKQKPSKPSKVKSPVSSAKVETHLAKRKVTTQKSSPSKPSSKPRPWYCFQCGEDGHIVSACDNEPNPSLVAAKKKQLRERQAAWEASNAHSDKAHLN
ncbi:uncharacterized protein LOC141794744 [Halichoeres trimaculatus]|uniref:uncharacterized protein LOC141794744 n=1 Tax=Halichoeres trimaculatus TaxID=147232 RepID=UPI003D9EFB92